MSPYHRHLGILVLLAAACATAGSGGAAAATAEGSSAPPARAGALAGKRPAPGPFDPRKFDFAAIWTGYPQQSRQRNAGFLANGPYALCRCAQLM